MELPQCLPICLNNNFEHRIKCQRHNSCRNGNLRRSSQGSVAVAVAVAAALVKPRSCCHVVVAITVDVTVVVAACPTPLLRVHTRTQPAAAQQYAHTVPSIHASPCQCCTTAVATLKTYTGVTQPARRNQCLQPPHFTPREMVPTLAPSLSL